jgi:DNA-directed RNA polymerase subunit H (RpoH/RPB5)
MNMTRDHKKIILLVFTFIIIMILSFVFIADNFRKKEVDKEPDNEEIVDENPVIDTDEAEEIMITSLERLNTIKFLLEHYHFSAFNYNDTDEILISYIAHKFIDWDKNPVLSEEQKTFIMANYEIEDWQLERYIPYSDVEAYYLKMTGKEPKEKDSATCMKYISEYDIYVHVDGHGLWAGSPEYLVFGDESGKSEFYYVERILDLKNGNYTFEVQRYDLNDEHYNMEIEDSKKILEDFIYGKINSVSSYLTPTDKTVYLMKKNGNDWQFIAHNLKAL